MSSINNSEKHNINRGIELILRKPGGKKDLNLKMKEFVFEKVFSFLNREAHLRIELKMFNKT